MEPSLERLLAPLDQYGGLTDFTKLDEDVRLFWQLPVRYLADALEPARMSPEQPDTEFPSYVALIRNGQFNAVIRHMPDAVIAGIFVGVPLIALKACRMLALRLDMATGLPNCDAEDRIILYPEKHELPTKWSFGDNPQDEAAQEIFTFEAEISTHNNELALFMFDIIMRYVAMHECMHFVLGHARYCQIELGMDVFEDGAKRRAELPPHVGQALEFMSDRHVIVGLLQDLQDGRIFHEWSRSQPPGLTISAERWYRRVLFVALSLVSRLWTVPASMTFGNLSQPYPHPYERLCWMHATLGEHEGDQFADDTMRAIAYTLTTLDMNFISPYQLKPDLERDARLLALTGSSALDNGYEVVKQEARRLQTDLFQQFGPYYPLP